VRLVRRPAEMEDAQARCCRASAPLTTASTHCKAELLEECRRFIESGRPFLGICSVTGIIRAQRGISKSRFRTRFFKGNVVRF